MNTKSRGLGSEIYSGAAEFGRIRAIMGVIFGTIIGIACIIGGIVLIRKKVMLNATITGTVSSDPACRKYTDKNSNFMYDCSGIYVKYTLNNTLYTLKNTRINSGINYKNGDKIKVYYQSNKPSNASLLSDNTHIAGWIILVVGLLILAGSWFWFIMAMRYKFVAAAEGVAGAAGLVANAIR